MLNSDQQAALDQILTWVKRGGDPFFVLSGFAGTGKTFTVKELRRQGLGRVVFTAPTNKATRVLRTTLTEEGYKPECCTIFSLLKLRLEATGEVKELNAPAPGDEKYDLSEYKLVVIDECGMISSKLFKIIEGVSEAHPKVKFLFMGDPAQLPPVGEKTSPVWEHEGASLRKVMRYDNALLGLAAHLREQQGKFIPRVVFTENREQGIWKVGKADGLAMIRERVALGHFTTPEHTKVIAWRNITVQTYNAAIRKALFPEVTTTWVAGDRIIMTSPAKDLEDKPIARTDEEGTVQRVSVDFHPVYGEFKCFSLFVEFDAGYVGTLKVLHSESHKAFDRKCEDLAAKARGGAKINWKFFWELKDTFHQVRYAYALTAHRAQGSTYETVFIDWRDVMMNNDNAEMLKCLYVACTRARKELVLV